MQHYDHDLLYGIDAIASYLGLTSRQTKHLIGKRTIPTFKAGRIVCATKSAIAASIASKQVEHEGGQSNV